MVSSCRFTHLMPQSTTFIPFRTPIPAISHFDLFGLRPENCEKCLNICSRFITDLLFLRKKVVSSALAVRIKFLLKNFKTFNI